VNPASESWIEQLRPVLETLNQGVVVNDENGRMVFANSIFKEMIRMPAEQFIGRPVRDLYPPEDVPKLLGFMDRRKTAGRSLHEFYLLQGGGKRMPILVTARSVESPGGEQFAIVTVTDMSEQKRVEAELLRANQMLEERQREIEQELLLAARVQQSLAPQTLAWGGISVETFYQPVGTIGGDFGLIVPGKESIDLLVCDVSGHGIGSALVANRIYSETISQIEGGAALNSLLQHLNRFAVQKLSSAAFYFTMAAARIDHAGRNLQFAGAGHPPAMVVAAGEPPRMLESRSPILGVFDDLLPNDATCSIPMKPGERVVIYTDGFTEAFDLQRQMLGIGGLADIVRETSALPLPQMKDAIVSRVAAWRSGGAVDDMSLVLAEVS
jgi:PAS domain S-box-containing protein